MPQPTIIAVGELLVEFVSHREGCELRELSDYSGPYPSGAPAICIDQAALTGASTRLYGTVGNDNFGIALTDRLQTHDVGTEGIAKVTDRTTGVAFVSYFKDGSRTFIFHLSNTAADAIKPEQIDLPDSPIIMHVSGSSLGNESLRESIVLTAEKVIEQGGKLSCDPNARPELMSQPNVKAVLKNLIAKSSYLFPSDSDLEFLYPELSTADVIATLLTTQIESIALTRGRHGCSLYSADSEPLTLAGHSVTEVDPTGAGDCFCGTFLSLMSQGKSVEECGRYANAAGAIAVTKRGPMEGNSSITEIESFIENNPAALTD
jgi:sugar/nucleoside kinase (ribokinase family)